MPTLRDLATREQTIGYWSVLDSAVVAEKLAGVGYDVLFIDLQHGTQDQRSARASIGHATEAGCPVIVRVPSGQPHEIGWALDAGAAGTLTPMVETVDQVRAAVLAGHYPPAGMRSFGPTRGALAPGVPLAEADAEVVTLVMIETIAGLEAVEEICRVPGLTGVLVGPVDLGISLGARYPGDPAIAEVFEDALARVRQAASAAGVAVGMYVTSGAAGRDRLDEGFTFVAVANDLAHLVATAAAELDQARRRPPAR